MKRTLLVALMGVGLLLAGATAASADFRMDIDVPWFLHVGLSPALEEELGAEFGIQDVSRFAVVVPNIQMYYMFDLGPVSIGPGARIYTVLLMNFLYPSVMGEVRFGRFDVNLNMGGLAGVLMGIGPTFETTTGPWVTMDLSAGFRVTDWFRVGLGAFAIAHREYLDMFPYAVYLSGKFILGPGRN